MRKYIDKNNEQERLLSIIGSNCNDIFILSGGIDIRFLGLSWKWKASPWSFRSGENKNGLWGKTRLLAAIHINNHINNPDFTFHTDAYQTQEKEKELWITHAHVCANYLKNRGIKNINIHNEDWIINTITEIVNILYTMIKDNISEVAIISSDDHISRIKAILDIILYNKSNINNRYIDNHGGIRNTIIHNINKYSWFDILSVLSIEDIDHLSKQNPKIHIISSEEILKYTAYNQIIQSAKNNIANTLHEKNMWTILHNKTKEKKGIEMLYNGTYYISNEDKNTYFSNDKY